MINKLPAKLLSFIDSESIDFAVKGSRFCPLKKSFSFIFFGILLITFIILSLNSMYQSERTHLTIFSDLVLTITFGTFLLLGIIMLLSGIYSIFRKGGYFVGTPTRLIYFQNGYIRSIGWEQLSNDISVSGNAQKGNIILKIKTSPEIDVEDESDEYAPYDIYILGIPNVFEIEKICRKRIKENDPSSTIRNSVI